MNMNEPPSLLRNDLKTHTGGGCAAGNDIEPAGIGATVRVTAGGRAQARAVLSQSSYYSHDDLRAHFGLGDAARVDRVEVTWPDGRTESATNVAADRSVVFVEGSGTLVERPPRVTKIAAMLK